MPSSIKKLSMIISRSRAVGLARFAALFDIVQHTLLMFVQTALSAYCLASVASLKVQ
jgi:hypothetical protein